MKNLCKDAKSTEDCINHNSRCFTKKEGGEQHCQIGNHSIAVDAILDWIERIS